MGLARSAWPALAQAESSRLTSELIPPGGSMRRIPMLVPLAGVLVAAACSSPTAPTTLSSSVLKRAPAASPIPGISIYGQGGPSRSEARAICLAPRFRQFDFWLGDWSVSNAANPFVGINPVTSELGGCVLEEHWHPVAVAGGPPAYPGK